MSLSWEWAAGIVVLFPALLLIVNELLQRALRQGSRIAPTLRSFRNLLIPAVGIVAIVHYVFALPATHPADRTALTIFWTCVLICALQFINDIVFGAARPGTWRANVPSLFRDLVRSLLVGLGAAWIYSEIWGHELAGALTALGVGSLVIGLALQEPLGNVFSGLMLLAERPVGLGDWIQVDDKTGRVVEMNWRAVNMRTITNETIIVPNSALYKTSFANLSRPSLVRTLTLELSFGFNDPPSKVKQVLYAVARSTPGVLEDPAPEVRLLKFGEYAVVYEVCLSVERQEEVRWLQDEFQTRVWYAAQRESLTIPYPVAMEVGAELHDFAPKHPSAQEVLASNKRFQDSAGTPGLGMKTLVFTKGETLLQQGDEQDGLCLILDGQAALRLKTSQSPTPIEIGVLGPGDFYGEHSILAGSPSEAALVALTDVQVAMFDLESSRRLVHGSQKLAREVGEVIDQRRHAVDAALKSQAAARGAGHS